MNIETYYVPIRIRALKFASVYRLNTGNHSYMIDSGMDRTAMEFLESNGLDFKSINAIILTHMHIDHIGGAKSVQEKYGIPVYINSRDREKVLSIQNDISGFLRYSKTFLAEMGVPGNMTEAMGENHPIAAELNNYEHVDLEVFEKMPSTLNEIEYFHVPGHSPGSTCFLPKNSGVIFTGDHILQRITPNISYYDEKEDMLMEYIESLNKTKAMGKEKAFPGHGEPFEGINERIDQIISHHNERIREIGSILEDGKKTAYEVATKMHWSRGRTMDSMNLMERNFAVGEAIAHLRYMENKGYAESHLIGGIRYYRSVL